MWQTLGRPWPRPAEQESTWAEPVVGRKTCGGDVEELASRQSGDDAVFGTSESWNDSGAVDLGSRYS